MIEIGVQAPTEANVKIRALYHSRAPVFSQDPFKNGSEQLRERQ